MEALTATSAIWGGGGVEEVRGGWGLRGGEGGLRGVMVRKQAGKRVERDGGMVGWGAFLKGFEACLDRESGSRWSVYDRGGGEECM